MATGVLRFMADILFLRALPGRCRLNWMNILVFSLLAAWYGWFACVERIAVFEGLDKSMQ
ncbi:hypothetical protein EON66_06350 [archaeon]|nr:MAG: hypothetical protein EON66_06350 [archaeon]